MINMENREEITSRQYAEKIVEVAFFKTIPHIETICNVVDALINEYANQQNKQLLDEIERLKNEVSNCNRMIGHLEEISINKQSSIDQLKFELKAADSVNEKKDKEIAKLKFMVSNGLGFEDLRNDI